MRVGLPRHSAGTLGRSSEIQPHPEDVCNVVPLKVFGGFVKLALHPSFSLFFRSVE